ncbi:MAPEG family protein [Parvularcula sp. IMCC14364]|uniref:MAPEG family protein n=1 Tax=Parvularcula sp. IMCC14364 TaxID=3067902 RepID=UPI002740BBA9|nr:MAPEG family protein [Parvularcula sp. IMCC14364]
MFPAQAMMIPVFVQVTLTIFLFARVAAIRNSEIRADTSLLKTAAIDSTRYSQKAQQLANNYNSQFQAPVLFYAIVAFAMLTASESFLLAALGGLFVLTRIIHSTVHTGSNNVLHRFMSFAAGYLVLALMWFVFGFTYFL